MNGHARRRSAAPSEMPPSVLSRGSLAIIACWSLLVLGVLFVPAVCLFLALITAGPIESSGPPPRASEESIGLFWAARVSATASALGALTITGSVTARGGRLVNGWIVVLISTPIVAVLWDLQLG